MKHIKSIKIFENTSEQNEIIETCEDILLDLKDDGYSSYARPLNSRYSIRIKILSINKQGDDVKIFGSNIRESITRIRNYMHSIRYKPVNLHFNHHYYQIDYIKDPILEGTKHI